MDGNEASLAEHERRRRAREARAARYLQDDLKNQREWYDRRASRFRTLAQLLGLAVLIAGALTSFLQALGPRAWVPAVTAFLGGLVVIAEGWQRIARYGESWVAYRVAAQRMEREGRLYANGAGEYRGLADEEEVFLLFVENVEAVLAEEQQVFWQQRGSDKPSGQAALARTTAEEDGIRG